MFCEFSLDIWSILCISVTLPLYILTVSITSPIFSQWYNLLPHFRYYLPLFPCVVMPSCFPICITIPLSSLYLSMSLCSLHVFSFLPPSRAGWWDRLLLLTRSDPRMYSAADWGQLVPCIWSPPPVYAPVSCGYSESVITPGKSYHMHISQATNGALGSKTWTTELECVTQDRF